MRFLIFGDVVGKPGREAISYILPELKKEYRPDSVIINIENMAGGRGVSPKTWTEAVKWGADVYTTGDHGWDTAASVEVISNRNRPIIRPANYPDGVPGRGYHVYNSGAWRVAVINLQGQVFFKNDPENPFHYLDRLLEQPEIREADIKLVDWHADATSEARGLGWYADGRVTAVWGTHTHVPTADAQILPKGTGYITDVGMVGLYHSILGTDVAGPLRGFLTQLKFRQEFNDKGPREVNALLLEVDPRTSKTKTIENIRRIIDN